MVSEEKAPVVEDLVWAFLNGWVERLRHLNHRIREHDGREDFRQEMITRRDTQLPLLYALAIAYYGYRPETLLTIERDLNSGRMAAPGVLKVWAFRSDRIFVMCDANACGCGTIPVRDELPKRRTVVA